jgi:hypothetical protein
MMLQQHRNAFMEAIRKAGLEPTLFSASTTEVGSVESKVAAAYRSLIRTEETKVFVIQVKNSPLKFAVECSQDDFYKFRCKSTKLEPNFSLGWWSGVWPFEQVMVEFAKWLNGVAKKYIEDNCLPDYWDQIGLYEPFVNNVAPSTGARGKFTEEEKQRARRSMKRFHALIGQNFEVTADQETFIDERLDYLSNALDRLNRFDWNGLAMSVVAGIAINLAVDTERGRLLFKLFQQAFESTFRLLG